MLIRLVYLLMVRLFGRSEFRTEAVTCGLAR
jgi:hypothetical protein